MAAIILKAIVAPAGGGTPVPAHRFAVVLSGPSGMSGMPTHGLVEPLGLCSLAWALLAHGVRWRPMELRLGQLRFAHSALLP